LWRCGADRLITQISRLRNPLTPFAHHAALKMISRLLIAFILFHLTSSSQKPFWIHEESALDAWDEHGLLERKDDEISPAFAGMTTFAHLPFINCLHPVYTEESEEKFDIAIVGAPFDTSVTYRPGYVYFLYCGVIVELGLDLPGYDWEVGGCQSDSMSTVRQVSML
jgi:hypothetical protein